MKAQKIPINAAKDNKSLTFTFMIAFHKQNNHSLKFTIKRKA